MTQSPRRVLVTGATGFIGTHVVRALLSAGWAVDAMVREPPSRSFGPGVRLVPGNLDSPDQFSALVSGTSAVVHLAAFLPPSWVDSLHADTLVRRNALATLRLAESTLEVGGRRFVYVSSGNSFAPGVENPTEDCPLYPVARATYYLASKVLGEFYVEHLRRTLGLDAVTLRITSTYGDGMPPSAVVARFMSAAARGGTLDVRDGGVPTYDLVYVGDVVAAIVRAASSSPAGVYNVGGGRAYTVAEIASAAAAVYEERRPCVRIVPPDGPPAPGFPSLSIDRARAAWQYEPTPLAVGLASMRCALEGRK